MEMRVPTALRRIVSMKSEVGSITGPGQGNIDGDERKGGFD
jgi:hypothetical protein